MTSPTPEVVEKAIRLLEETPIGDVGSNIRPRRSWEQKRDEVAEVIAGLRELALGYSRLVEEAYREGWRDSENSTNGIYCIQESESWERSKARAAIDALTGKGGGK